MNRSICFLATLLITTVFSGCYKPPIISDVPAQKIVIGNGPEDMVLDTLYGKSRLLISCSNRREALPDFGEIVSYDLVSGIVDTLERVDEPEDIVFRPHGIYLDGMHLYVISHEDEPDDHIVLIYTLEDDKLIFNEVLRSPLLNSPNALVTGPSGEIYVVNDSGKRGSLAEKLFKLKRANILRFDKSDSGTWNTGIVAQNLGYPAGINRIGNKIYAGDAVLHKIHVYSINENGLNPISEIKGLRGNDNIRIHNGQLLVPGHVKPFKFVKHAGDSTKMSPVDVYLVNPESGDYKSLFFDDGQRISGGSTAIIFENRLYICQVFEPFILQVDLN